MSEQANQDGQAVARVLTIVLHENGAIRVQGPVNDKLLCYGMLEGAKDAIRAHGAAAAAMDPKKLVIANGSPAALNRIKGN